MGYQPTDEIKDAQVVLLNTCAIRENAEEKVFGKIGYLKKVKRTNPVSYTHLDVYKRQQFLHDQ